MLIIRSAPLAGTSLLITAIVLTLPVAASTDRDGGVSLGQTRVIFPATGKPQTLTVQNTGRQTYLVQSRVQRAADDNTSAPFIVTPPLFTLGPDSRQQLRIVSQNATLPLDRESLFFLSVLTIPSRSDKIAPPVQLSMGVRFVIKLFYRPGGLAISPTDAACQLRFSRVAQGVQIENPTPYFQTLASLTFNHSPVSLDEPLSMLAPMSQQQYPTTGTITQAEWQTVTDYGGLSPHCQKTVTPSKETP